MATSQWVRSALVLGFCLMIVLLASYQSSPGKRSLDVATQPGVLRPRQSPGVKLRVMPLGDSITYGFQSSDGNGYRGALYDLLDANGRSVDFIGSSSSGNMADPQNEGHSGFIISAIGDAARYTLRQRPNLVLIHAGTNDLNHSPPEEPYDAAPSRLGALIDEVLCTCPDAVVLVAQIITSTASGTASRIRTFNAAVPDVVRQRSLKGFKVRTVDFSSIGPSDLYDSLHPNDGGYRKMADIWNEAVRGLPSGWITAPQTPTAGSVSGAQQCASNGLFWVPANGAKEIASGVGTGGDGKFTGNWVDLGKIASGIGLNGSGVMFADIDGDGKAEYLWVNETTGAMKGYYNKYGTAAPWVAIAGGKSIAGGVGPRKGVRFGDLDGDGRDDYLYVHSDGSVDAYLSRGPSDTGWAWKQVLNAASGVSGANQDTVLFADVNGDGRADYCVKNSNGGLDIYLNIGNPNSASDIVWTPYTKAAGGLGNPNITLADLDGDGRADYLIFDKNGGLDAYINVRGKTEGQPVWISQGGAKSVAGGVAPWRNVRIADLNGDGKDDYIVVDEKNGAISAYLNQGSGNTHPRGDAVRIADLDGDGRDDYIAVDENGAVVAYRNGGVKSDGSWTWFPVYDAKAIATGIGAKQRQIHFADINGDGKADYLAVDDTTGAVTCYINGGPRTDDKGWLWIDNGKIASGLGPGEGVRFADIDGDGRADYIWLSRGGAATVYINQVGINPANWVALNDGNPIATGVGAMRRDVRFADIDGDGRAEYIWVHPVRGNIEIWTNGGPGSDGGWIWIPQGEVASGIGFSGPSITFGRIGTSGRADYIAVDAGSSAITVYLNSCNQPIGSGGEGSSGGGSSGDDDSSCGSPPLEPGNPDDPGSGTSSTDVYIAPSIWSSATPVVSCIPPCNIILPPYSWPTAKTLTFPPFTTVLTERWGSTSSTSALVLTFPPVTTTRIPLYNLNITRSGVDKQTFRVTESVLRTSVVTIGPPPGVSSGPITITVTSTPNPSSTTPVITDRPPRVSMTSTTPAGPSCTAGDCGGKCRVQCNDCDNNICSPQCRGCLPPPILPPFPPPGPPGGNGDGPGGGEEPTGTCTTSTVSSCIVSYITTPRQSATRTTSCQDRVGCSVTATTSTTSTIVNDLAAYGADYDEQRPFPFTTYDAAQRSSIYSDQMSYLSSINLAEGGATITPAPSYIPCDHFGTNPDRPTAYCVCASSTFPERVITTGASANSCAYTTRPAQTTSVGRPTNSVSTDRDNCQVCTIDGNNGICTTIANCTPKPTYLFTSTNGLGDVIACETESPPDTCSGSSTTATTHPNPEPTEGAQHYTGDYCETQPQEYSCALIVYYSLIGVPWSEIDEFNNLWVVNNNCDSIQTSNNFGPNGGGNGFSADVDLVDALPNIDFYCDSIGLNRGASGIDFTFNDVEYTQDDCYYRATGFDPSNEIWQCNFPC